MVINISKLCLLTITSSITLKVAEKIEPKYNTQYIIQFWSFFSSLQNLMSNNWGQKLVNKHKGYLTIF